jgi:RNA polymerase sigma-70 factor (ECF subfamily)
MQEPRDDAELIVASWEQPAVFAAVFERHFPAIHRYLQRRLGPDLADDLAAETFVQALRSRRRYDVARSDARPWLHGIAANLLRHHHRDERRRLLAYARTASEGAPTFDDHDLVDAKVDARAAGPRLALALAALRGGDRDVLLLFAWAELSYEEISRALGIPVGTVRSRLSRARRRVRELVGDPGQYPGEDVVRHVRRGATHG